MINNKEKKTKINMWLKWIFDRVVALNVPAGQWHTVKALESGSVILEMKGGAYEPLGEEDVMEI